MKKLLFFLSTTLLVFLEGGSELFAQPYRHISTGLSFPEEIATLKRGSVKEYENDNPGLGTSIGYDDLNIHATIFIYNLRQKSVPNDVKSPILVSHFDQVMGDIYLAEKSGIYANVQKISQGETRLSETYKKAKALSAKFSFEKDGIGNYSYLYLLGTKDNFMKVRFSYYKDNQEKAEIARIKFLDVLAKMVE